jgi:hypothetical protein
MGRLVYINEAIQLTKEGRNFLQDISLDQIQEPVHHFYQTEWISYGISLWGRLLALPENNKLRWK